MVKHSASKSLETDQILRAHAELEFSAELTVLEAYDQRQRPPHWRLSPWAVKTYL